MPILNKIVEEKKDKKHLKVIEKINHIKHLIDEGKFISNSTEPILAFKTFIIDVWEGDKPKDIDSVIEIINSIDIPLKE